MRPDATESATSLSDPYMPGLLDLLVGCCQLRELQMKNRPRQNIEGASPPNRKSVNAQNHLGIREKWRGKEHERQQKRPNGGICRHRP